MNSISTAKEMKVYKYLKLTNDTSGSASYYFYMTKLECHRQDFADHIISNYYLEKKCNAFKPLIDNFEIDFIKNLGRFDFFEDYFEKYTPNQNLNLEWISELYDIEDQIHTMELKTGISSEEFINEWKNDNMPDTFENNAWAILIEARNSITGF